MSLLKDAQKARMIYKNKMEVKYLAEVELEIQSLTSALLLGEANSHTTLFKDAAVHFEKEGFIVSNNQGPLYSYSIALPEPEEM